MMEIIRLPATDLVNLIEDKKLPLTYSIKAQVEYCFYIEKYLYGIYQLKVSTAKFHYLKKMDFKPIKIISPALLKKENHKKIINTFQNENKPSRHLLIKIVPIKSKLYIHYASLSLGNLISRSKIDLSDEIKESFSQIKKLLELDSDKVFFQLKEIGLKFFNTLLPSQIKQLINSASHISLSAPYYLNLLSINDNETFFLLQKITNFHHPIRWAKRKLNHQPTTSDQPNANKNTIKSFAFFSSHEDSTMEKEIEVIKNIFQKKCRRPFSIYNQVTSDNIQKNLAYQDLAHLIYHGKKQVSNNEEIFTLLQNNKPLLKSTSLLSSPAPKVLILDVCYSKTETLINNFFRLGGQTLIVGEGKIFTKNLVRGWEIFYWWLFYKKATVKTAFYKMLQQLLFVKDTNVFKLHLIGHGQERVGS